MTDDDAAARKRAAARTPSGQSQAWEDRTALVKQMTREENAAADAKTARLKALRLEKERQDAETAETAAPAPAKPRVRRIVAG